MKKKLLLSTYIIIMLMLFCQWVNAQNPLAPAIISFTPVIANPVGPTTITIVGKKFNNVSSVTFNGVAAVSFSVAATHDTISAIAPDAGMALSMGATPTGSVTVTTTFGTASMPTFYFAAVLAPPPTITSFTPQKARSGQLVTISGYAFSINGQITSLSFGGTPAYSFTISGDTAIYAIIGSGATGNIVITTSTNSFASIAGFTFVSTPVVTTNTPSNITSTTASISGNIVLAGDDSIWHRGFVYNTTGNPTLYNDPSVAFRPISGQTINTILSGTGPFSGTLIGLQPATRYYAKAYAINSVDTGYGPEISFVTSGTLPITFKNITSQQNGNNITHISWNVGYEIGISYYTIETSTDGINYTAIGKRLVTTTNNTGVYFWDDTTINKGVNYYRIKAVGASGEIEYSTIVQSIFRNKNSSVIIYPNPVRDGHIKIEVDEIAAAAYTVRVTNFTGKEVFRIQINSMERNNIRDIYIGNTIAKGIYTIQLTTAKQVIYASKFIVE